MSIIAAPLPSVSDEATIERSVRRRIGVIWALLFLNVLTYTAGLPMVITIPSTAGKAITQGALWVALVLVIALLGLVAFRSFKAALNGAT